MRFHRGTEKTPESGPPEKTSSVHVLSDEQDLREALQRAAEYDQRTADLLLSRSAHYRVLLADPSEPRRRRTRPPVQAPGDRPRAAPGLSTAPVLARAWS